MERERIDWIKLSMVPEIGAVCFKKLIDCFNSPSNVVSASLNDLENVEGITKNKAQTIWKNLKNVDIENELNLIDKHQVKVVTIRDEDYPNNLKYIYDPPFLLYTKGEFLLRDTVALSIVGARNATVYGRMVAEKLSSKLATMGVTIVSGLARGIDTEAHKGAIAGGGRTIAVLGNGLSQTYPKENKCLETDISKHGVVISEFSMKSNPGRINFPMRNRIISGLSLGTIIVEAKEKSGALITANFAIQQGREVFAIPGNIFSKYSKGTNNLIKQGAKLVQGIEDIVEEIGALSASLKANSDPEELNKKKEYSLSFEEQKVYNCLYCEPLHIDYIVQQCGLPVQNVSACLMNMEMKGLVKQISGKNFMRRDLNG